MSKMEHTASFSFTPVSDLSDSLSSRCDSVRPIGIRHIEPGSQRRHIKESGKLGIEPDYSAPVFFPVPHRANVEMACPASRLGWPVTNFQRLR